MQKLNAVRTPSVDDADDMAIDLRAVLRTLWRGKFVIALAALVFIGLAVAYIAVRTPTYEATASVLVDGGAEQQLGLRTVTDAPLNESAVASQINVLLSNRVLGAVVDALDLASDPDFVPALRTDVGGLRLGELRFALGRLLEPITGPLPFLSAKPGPSLTEAERADLHRRIAIATLTGKVTASQVGSSYVIRVAVETDTPVLAAALANAVVRNYIDVSRTNKLSSSTNAVEWLTEQISELENQVGRSTNAVNRFRIENGLTGEGQIEQSAAQLDRLRSSLLDARQVRETLLTERAAASVDAPGSVAALDARIETMRSREGALMDSIEAAEAELSRLVTQRAQFDQLERQALADQRLYERFLDETNVVDALETYQQADASIVADALVPLRESNPSAKILVALAAVLGVGFGIAIIGLRELLNRTFRSREELATFAHRPVVGILPRWGRRTGLDKLIVNLREAPRSLFAESVRSLRAGALQKHGQRQPQVVMVTSASAGEGKSSTALLLAASAAELGKAVLFIDCDLRRSRTAKALKLKPTITLSDVLLETHELDDALVSLGSRSFDMLLAERPSRRSKAAPVDLLSSEAMADLIADMRESYDLIVLDTPPVLPVMDAALLSRHADSCVLVVQWRRTSSAVVADALDSLGTFGAHVDSLVLNRVDLRVEASYRSVPQHAYAYQSG